MKNEKPLVVKNIEAPKNDINIGELLSQAISQNVSVDTVERLLAIRKQLKDEWAKEQFDKSLAAFQGECPVVKKRKKVDFTAKSGARTKYNYAPIEDIVEQVKPILTRNGFSYMFDTETNGKMRVICKVKHISGHMETTTFQMEIDPEAKMNISQKYGSALTYAKRYAFCAAFAINVKDEDTDAHTSQDTQTETATSVKQEPPKIAKDACPECHAPAGKLHASKCSLNK